MDVCVTCSLWKDCRVTHCSQLLDCAAQNCALGVDPVGKRNVLAGMAVCTLFLNHPRVPVIHSTMAAQRLGADVLNFDASSVVYEQG